jgi:hypothetical protein
VSEHLTTRDIEACRAGKLAAEQVPYVYDHLAACESCGRLIGGAEPLRQTLDGWRDEFTAEPPEHIAYEQLTAYIEQSLDGPERELIDSHLQVCEPCAAEARDLLLFSAEFKAATVNQATTNGLPRQAAGQTPAPTFWQRVAAYWDARGYAIALQVAFTATAIVLCVWLATRSLRSDNNRLQEELAKARQDQEALQQQYNASTGTVDNLQAQLNDLQQSSIQNLKPEGDNSVMVALKDGEGQITLDAAGNLTGLTGLPPLYQQMIKTALISERAPTPAAVVPLMQRVGILRGGSGEGVAFALLSPVGTNVSSPRPSFRWSPVKGATHYLVAVYDENFNWVATSQPLTTTSWTVINELKRGATYLWQVSAVTPAGEIKSPLPPAPEARFKVLEQAKAREVSQLKKSAANSHLAGGLIDLREGLLDDAEREFELLLQSNTKSAIARKLLHQVKALRNSR